MNEWHRFVWMLFLLMLLMLVNENGTARRWHNNEKNGSQKSGKPCTDSLRRSRSTTGVITGGSTGNDNDDLLLQLIDPGSSISVSSLMVGVNWFLFGFSSGVRSIVSGVSGVFGLSSSGSDMQILFTDKLSGFIDFGTSKSMGFCKRYYIYALWKVKCGLINHVLGGTGLYARGGELYRC